jgi:hypothetical protein
MDLDVSTFAVRAFVRARVVRTSAKGLTDHPRGIVAQRMREQIDA